MGNEVLGKRSSHFYKGFNEEQLTYLKEKFELLKDEKGNLSKDKVAQEYRCSKGIAAMVSTFLDLSENSEVDEYQFICSVAALCNSPISKLSGTIFNILSSGKTEIDEKALLEFTSTALSFIKFKEGKEKDLQDKNYLPKLNRRKFKNANFDANKYIDKEEFTKFCLTDNDFKQWMFYMGLITRKQLKNQTELLHNDYDSDLEMELQRHTTTTDPDVDNIKMGIEHKLQSQKLTVVKAHLDDEGEQAVGDFNWRKESLNMDMGKVSEQRAPSQNLMAEYVFGYRGYDSRNNLHYNSSGKLVYPTAALGIVLDAQNSKQDFVYAHNNDVTCLDVVGDMVVTGEMGTKPMALVWSSEKGPDGSLPVLHYLTEGLLESIGNVAISPSKRFVAVSCNNEDHNIVIYDLNLLNEAKRDLSSKETGIAVSDKAAREIIIAMKFTFDDKYLIVATLKEVLLFTFTNGKLKSNRGLFDKYPSASPLSLCLLEDERQFVSGMSNGAIYIWEGQMCVRSLSGHHSPVYSVRNRSDKKRGKLSLVSGDKDGNIIVWNEKFEIERTFEIPRVTDNHAVVGLSTYTESILVGTRGCEIFEIRLNEKDPIIIRMQSHASKELKALCVGAPDTIYTGGDDRQLFKWKITEKVKTASVRSIRKYPIKGIDYSPNTNLLAVAYKNGLLELLDGNTLENSDKKPITLNKNPDRDVISLVKFDREGKFLAVCYTVPKNVVMLYDVMAGKYIGEMFVESRVISLDFTSDSKKVQLNTESQEYLAFDIAGRKDAKIPQIKELDTIPQQPWHSHTLTMSKPTEGIFTSGITEGDMTCCDVNPDPKNRNCLVVGDKFSNIKLFTYPCLLDLKDDSDQQVFNKYKGHAGSVSSVKFTRDQKYLVSIGAQDKTVILWRYDGEIINNNMGEEERDVKDAGEEAMGDQFDEMMQKQEADGSQKKKICYDGDDMYEMAEDDVGEQAMATKAFAGNMLSRTDFKRNENRDNKVPNESMKIMHSFGIRTFYLADEVRNQAKFNKDGKKIVYPTAALGVEMEIASRKQDFYQGHKEDIVSFALDPKRQIAATGQMAQLNASNPRAKIVSIHVWDLNSKEQLKMLNGFHTIAVVLLQFSPDSTLLFSCGNDNQNSYAVYNWKAGAILYSGPVSKGKVNGVAWKNNSEFATCGNDHIKFWTKNKSIQGRISEKKSQQMFSIANSNQVYISGGSSGGLYNWIGGSAARTKAHDGKVHTLVISNNQLFSGSEDGTIMIWPLEKSGGIKLSSKTIDMRKMLPLEDKLAPKEYSVLSIDFSTDGNTLLLVTGGCEVLVVNRTSLKYEKLLSGHYKKEVWGLATNPEADDQFVTTGDDGTIRLWSIKDRRMVRRQGLDGDVFVRAIDWSPKGDYIVAADSTASLHLFSPDLRNALTGPEGFKTTIREKRFDKKYPPWVEEIKVSPNGNLIALGGHNKGKLVEIIKYSNEKLERLKTFEETSSILHIDWNTDSSIISTNSQSYELNFYNITNVESSKPTSNMISASSCRDADWATWTRKIGFDVQGIFQGVDFSDVKSVCVDRNKQIVAVGYTDQTIRLFRYPAYVPKQIHKEFHGHSSFVTRVRFNNRFLVSVGGNDKTIIVWEVSGRMLQSEKVRGQEEDEEILESIDLPNAALPVKQLQETEEDEFVEVEDVGDEFMAVKPWLGAIREPTYNYPVQTEAPPKVSIELEFVYGYRCKDSRQNIFYHSESNSILYHAAAVVIIHNTKENRQKFNTDHEDDILSISYHRDTDLVLTGQLGAKPLVILSQKGKKKNEWRNAVTKGVLCLAISPSGDKAVCVGMDDDHTVAVINLSTSNSVITKGKGGKEIILKVQWIDDQSFVTAGIKHYRLWKLDGKELTSQRGNTKLCLVSLAVGNGMILTGGETNTLVSWKGNSAMNTIQLQDQDKQEASDTSKTSVAECISIRKSFVAVGCKNKRIFILDPKSLSVLSVILLESIIHDMCSEKSECASVRALDFSQDDTRMIVGTLGAEIYELTFSGSVAKSSKPVKLERFVKGHYSPNNKWTNEVWGLCIEDNTERFYTCSDDATVRCWDWAQRKLISTASLNYGPVSKEGEMQQLQKDKKLNDYVDAAKGRSVAISSDGKEVFVGCKNGVIRIFTVKGGNLRYKSLFRKATREISEIKFHNDILVVGSHDAHIYVYDYEEGNVKEKYKALKKHSSYITHLDISRDCSYLQSTCGAYELLFWDIQTGKQLTGGATMLKDERWATWTTTLGWPVQGIWPKYANGTFIHSTDRSHTNLNGSTFKNDEKTPYLLALGNNMGKIMIHNFPCKLKGSEGVMGKGHSSHITNVKWTPDDSRIISAGGQDQCIMQWKVTKGK